MKIFKRLSESLQLFKIFVTFEEYFFQCHVHILEFTLENEPQKSMFILKSLWYVKESKMKKNWDFLNLPKLFLIFKKNFNYNFM